MNDKINAMVTTLAKTFEGSAAVKNIETFIKDAVKAKSTDEKLKAIEEAIKNATSVVNTTYNYELDRVEVGGPTALYQFTKDVRSALRAEKNILLGKGNAENAKRLREKFAAVQQAK